MSSGAAVKLPSTACRDRVLDLEPSPAAMLQLEVTSLLSPASQKWRVACPPLLQTMVMMAMMMVMACWYQVCLGHTSDADGDCRGDSCWPVRCDLAHNDDGGQLALGA